MRNLFLIVVIALILGVLIGIAMPFKYDNPNWQIFIPAIIAAVSFVGKAGWDIYSKQRDNRIKLIEEQLSQFYYPILIRLEKDNVTWDRMLYKNRDDGSLEEKIGEVIEETLILPNHDEILEVIDKKAYLCQDDNIIKILVDYIKHISIYKAIRASGDKHTLPRNLGEELSWPNPFYPTLKAKTTALQHTLNRLTGR